MPPVTHTPTAQEQLLLEYLNALRTDPGGEFDRLIANAATRTGVQSNITDAISFFGVSVDALRSQLAAYTAVAPLAWNGALAASSETHTQLMIAQDAQSHQLPGEPDLGTRITNAGYTSWSRLGENVFAYTLDPLYGHAGFVIDWGYDSVDFQGGVLVSDWRTRGDGIQDPAGHRETMLNGSMTEVGMAMLAENNPATTVGPFLVTQNFGTRFGYVPQLLGVVITDADSDSFYDIGEGLAGITVTARGAAGTFTTTSWASGGYQMELPNGSYTVSFSGGALVGTASYSVTLTGQNLKLDAFARDAVAAPANLRLTGRAEAPDTLSGQGGNDALYGDGYRAAYDLADAQAIYRLYQATLDRAPDAAGFIGWTELLATDARSVLQVATGFVGSAEFQNVYGTLSNTAFVTLLYQNVLDRAPDAGGLAGWTNALTGGQSRAQVVLGFSESSEFRTNTNTVATQFTQDRNPAGWQDDVFRLYQATLDRNPDIGGFKSWLTNLGNGTPFLNTVASFVNSAEFQTTYGTLSNSAFVTLLYNNVLNRAPDAGGLTFWSNALAGGQSRAQVVQGFSQSGEFITATAPALETWIRAQGQDDVLDGNAGSNDLWGGIMADVFRFDREDAGTHRVHDLEAWDYLDFNGFGFTTGADIRAHMTQQGANVVFANQGTTVTLLNTQLAALDNDTFLF